MVEYDRPGSGHDMRSIILKSQAKLFNYTLEILFEEVIIKIASIYLNLVHTERISPPRFTFVQVQRGFYSKPAGSFSNGFLHC